MARTHGKDVNFTYNSVAIEDELNTVTLTMDVNEADATAFADTYAVPLAGKKSGVFELQGTVDPAVSQGVDTLFDARLDGAKSATFAPTGGSVGANDPHFTTTASGLTGSLFQSLRIVYNVGDVARYTAILQNSGETVRAVA